MSKFAVVLRIQIIFILIGSFFPIYDYNLEINPNSTIVYSNNQKEKLSILGSNLPENQESFISMGDQVMLQACYWNDFWKISDDGQWWTTIQNYIPSIQEAGFDSIWIPPACKTPEGDIARMGYEPYDYYDLGEFYQKGSIATRYGTRTELESLIQTANNHNLAIIADVVANHNVGGELEYNTFTDAMTPTNFMNISSGQFMRNYTHFHPCDYGESDAVAFGTLPDLCHRHPYVHDELIKYGEWLRDEIGVDGWRFDVANGIESFMLGDWINAVGGWGVAEYMVGESTSVEGIDTYLSSINYSLNAFDFPLLFDLRDMIIQNGSYDMRLLENAGFLGLHPDKAVTFMTNHDTLRTSYMDLKTNQLLGYSYILTHAGYPMVYWDDYFNPMMYSSLNRLIQIHNTYANGETDVIHTGDDVYVMQRTGNPGLIIAMNDNPNQSYNVSVSTQWDNTVLIDLTGHKDPIQVDSLGDAEITIPPQGYVIYVENSSYIEDSLSIPLIQRNENQILNYTIEVDGIPDSMWGDPLCSDRLGDASLKQYDFSNVYINHNQTHLFFGIQYGKGLDSKGPLEFGIILDTIDGGALDIPEKQSNVLWTHKNNPDFLLRCQFSELSNSLNEISSMSKFRFTDDQWMQIANLSGIEVKSDSQFGFAEIQIPLSTINLTEGGNLRYKIYSSSVGHSGVYDSIPHEDTIDPTGQEISWLTLSEPLTIEIASLTEQKIVGSSLYLNLLCMVVSVIFVIHKTREKNWTMGTNLS